MIDGLSITDLFYLYMYDSHDRCLILIQTRSDLINKSDLPFLFTNCNTIEVCIPINTH